MEFILRPGGLKNFAFVEKGVKPPKVHVISFATKWRRALKDEATFPVALGTSVGIQIWQHKLSGWECKFDQKCDDGVPTLAWHINAPILAYGDPVGNIFLVEWADYNHYEQFALYQDPEKRCVHSLSWNFSGNLAATFCKGADARRECVIFSDLVTPKMKITKSLNKTQIKKEQFFVQGSLAKLVPYISHLIIGGPEMNVVEVYTYVPGVGAQQTNTDSKGSKSWHFTMELDIKHVREISAFAPEETPQKHVVAFVTMMNGVHLCEVTNSQYNLDSKRLKRDVMTRLGEIQENREPEQTHSVSVSWQSTEKLAICYTDCSVAVFTEGENTKYILEDSMRWNADFKQQENPKLSIDWPRPEKMAHRFESPVLAVLGEGHAFINFFELRNKHAIGTAIGKWNIADELNHQNQPPASLLESEIEEAEATKFESNNRIFCNRPVQMEKIAAVGFEMQYVAAEVNNAYMDTVACSAALSCLVDDKGYPHEIKGINLKSSTMSRGLLVDKKRGNFLKVDKNYYINIAYHGFKKMQSNAIHESYGAIPMADQSDPANYALLDSFSSTMEAVLFANLINYMENFGLQKIKKKYEEVYQDIKYVFQTFRLRDGYHPTPSVIMNERFVPMLQELKQRGLKVFLLSNSRWDRTNIVMTHVCQSKHDWLDYFDVVVTSNGRMNETFFNSEGEQDLFKLDNKVSGSLLNTSCMQLFQSDTTNSHKVYQGGNVGHLLRGLKVDKHQVLYVTHQINRDVIYSPGWKNLVIIPELNQELEYNSSNKKIEKNINAENRKLNSVDDNIHFLEKMILKSKDGPKQKLADQVAHQNNLKKDIEQKCEALESSLSKFNGLWGRLLKAGPKKSLFADVVERNSYLYTSSATNLMYYSPAKFFDVSEEFMQHELD